ncbi:MAG: hypothetical protein R3D88_03165 [Alphaproteobacteria bacterium]|nr:hypothetical protein [Alphaproteobacteria bacterium]
MKKTRKQKIKRNLSVFALAAVSYVVLTPSEEEKNKYPAIAVASTGRVEMDARVKEAKAHACGYGLIEGCSVPFSTSAGKPHCVNFANVITTVITPSSYEEFSEFLYSKTEKPITEEEKGELCKNYQGKYFDYCKNRIQTTCNYTPE